MGFVQNVVGNVLVLGGFLGGGGVLHCQPLAFKKINGGGRSVMKIRGEKWYA